MLVLENRPGVVVEAAHQLRIQAEGYLLSLKGFFDGRKRFRARLAEVIYDARRVALQCLILGLLGVEEAKWVLFEARSAIGAELAQVRTVILAK